MWFRLRAVVCCRRKARSSDKRAVAGYWTINHLIRHSSCRAAITIPFHRIEAIVPLINIRSNFSVDSRSFDALPRSRLVDIQRAAKSRRARDRKSTAGLLHRIAKRIATSTAPEYGWHVALPSYMIASVLQSTFIRLDISSLSEKEPCRIHWSIRNFYRNLSYFLN